MNKQYVIFGTTLDAIANAIRTQTHRTDLLNPLDFPEEILNIDLSVEEYMRLTDLLEYPTPPNETWYAIEDITKVDNLIKHFESLGGDKNGK